MWAWVTCGSLERAEPPRGNMGRQCGTGGAYEAVNINKGAILQWIPVVRFILQEYWWCGVYRGCFSRGGLLTLLEALFSLEAERSNLSIHWWAALRVLLQANCNRSFLSLFFSLVKKISPKKNKRRDEGGIRRWSHFRFQSVRGSKTKTNQSLLSMISASGQKKTKNSRYFAVLIKSMLLQKSNTSPSKVHLNFPHFDLSVCVPTRQNYLCSRARVFK